MEYLEEVSEKVHDCYFVDLFVRPTNTAAIKFYEGLGYVVYRTVTGYYSGDEDAYDMRKPLPRDVNRKSLRLAQPEAFGHCALSSKRCAAGSGKQQGDAR
eukprot:s1806_g4.t1